ncbi:MAG: aldehyde dehydrogenase family protein [Bdellovibrionales bacterium]|jgi:aminomuconate-semialdehyde/2-hydroxymuconate-6-semialdehyde dehydrogenase|nr:aldehyde dehydrogenase family protein [Bdellovibrionales bacterium]
MNSSNIMDVVRIVQSMNQTAAAWGKIPRNEQREKLKRLVPAFTQALKEGATELEQLAAVEIGMPVARFRERALPVALGILSQSEAFLERELGGRSVPSAGHSVVFLGWSDPLVSFCRRVPLIIASGNAVCVKASSKAPRFYQRLSQVFEKALQDADLPVGFYSMLFGDHQLGLDLLQHPGLKTIFWIGKTDAALAAQAVAFEYGKRFHYSGSGRGPAILFQGFSDEKFDEIVTACADMITDPHGVGPYRPSRFFVQESIYKPFLELLAMKLEATRRGDPLDPTTRLGPLPKEESSRFDMQLKLALSETGKLVSGGALEGEFARPTLVRDLTNCSTLQGEELAGPWVTSASFKYGFEALKYANTSPLGLAGYIFHPDLEKAVATAEKLECSRIFFHHRPNWIEALSSSVAAVKTSGNNADGIEAIFRYGQWSSRWFDREPS